MLITTTKKFDKRLKKQPIKIQKEFVKRIKIFFNDPHNDFLNTHKLSGSLKDLWSFNISGDVRVVFDRSQENVIILVDIGSHSELYS